PRAQAASGARDRSHLGRESSTRSGLTTTYRRRQELERGKAPARTFVLRGPRWLSDDLARALPALRECTGQRVGDSPGPHGAPQRVVMDAVGQEPARPRRGRPVEYPHVRVLRQRPDEGLVPSPLVRV